MCMGVFLRQAAAVFAQADLRFVFTTVQPAELLPVFLLPFSQLNCNRFFHFFTKYVSEFLEL